MLDRYLSNLEQEFAKNGYEQFAKADPLVKICSLYAYYHFFSADSSKIDEVAYGIVHEPNDISPIIGVYMDYEADVETINVIIGMLTLGAPLDVPASLALFRRAETAVNDALNKKGNKKLISFFSEEEHKPSKVRPIAYKLLCDVSVKSASFKKSLRNGLAITRPSESYASFAYVLAPEIENDILEIEDPKEYVSEGFIAIDGKDNVLRFGREGSIIVNASALSIKGLFEQYSYRGLFSQNLRYYIANPKIDTNIVDSITTRPDNFWYYNNGIIVICDDYEIRGNEIRLSNFSIINGGQTTYLIGDTDFARDFFIQCKIIKNKYTAADDKLDFIATVAEATNTQKPIKSKDLVANQREQRILKKQLADAHIFCSIKRGQKVNKRLYPEAWQNTSNEELAQFLYSFMYQKPGSAKGGKASLCSNPDKYSLIFGKSYDPMLLKDLLLLKQYYKKWSRNTIKRITKDDGQKGSYKNSAAKYGMFFTLAIIGVIVKVAYYPSYLEKYKNDISPESKLETLSQFDFDHRILNERAKEEDIFLLFDYCSDLIIDGFCLLLDINASNNSIANFVKLDSRYNTYVLRNLMYKLQSPLPQKLEEAKAQLFYQRSDDDISLDNALLEEYTNSLTADVINKSRLPIEITNDIKEALTKYRTETYKKLHVKAYIVFKNIARDKIASYGATTLDELKELRCLDKKQLDKFGKDILEIIKEIYIRHGY